MRVNYILRAKLMTKHFAVVLVDAQNKVLSLIGPVGVTHPNLVTAGAWYFQILIKLSRCFIKTGSRGIPFAFAALRPLGRDAGTIDAPAWCLCFG